MSASSACSSRDCRWKKERERERESILHFSPFYRAWTRGAGTDRSLARVRSVYRCEMVRRVGGINIHQHPMFGWLKFVGLAGNFAPLPSCCNRLCDARRERERKHTYIHNIEARIHIYTRGCEREREGCCDTFCTEGEARRRTPGVGVRHRAMLHRGILIRVGRIGVCDVILHNN